MPSDQSAPRDPKPATSASDRSSAPAGRWLAAPLAALALGGILLPACGCSSVPDPINTPEQRLKRFVNPLGARAEEEAFKERVEDDPFPAASRRI